MEILNSAPQAPRMNAHCERMIGSIRREALDHVLIMNEAHARHVLAAYEQHYKSTDPTKRAISYHPTPLNNLPWRMTSTLTKSCVPGSSAVSSMSTAMPPDQPR